MQNGILWLAQQMTDYLREKYSLRYVNHDAMVALSGWMHGSNMPSDAGYALLDGAAEDLAEGNDPTNGLAVFADSAGRHYKVPEKVLKDLLEGE